MPSPSHIPASAHVCTDSGPAITAACIQYAVSQCGEYATLSQIIRALGLNQVTTPPAVEASIRAWLDNAGWERVKKTIGGVRIWGYASPAITGLHYVVLNPKPKAWKEYLRWAAQDLANPEILLDPARLALERKVTSKRLRPYMEEIVQLAWSQLQAQESALSNRSAP